MNDPPNVTSPNTAYTAQFVRQNFPLGNFVYADSVRYDTLYGVPRMAIYLVV